MKKQEFTQEVQNRRRDMMFSIGCAAVMAGITAAECEQLSLSNHTNPHADLLIKLFIAGTAVVDAVLAGNAFIKANSAQRLEDAAITNSGLIEPDPVSADVNSGTSIVK